MKNKNLKYLYIHEGIFTFGDSMILLVRPIFLYQLFNSIAVVFFWHLCWHIPHFFTFIPGFQYALRKRKTALFMVIGIFCSIASMIMLALAPTVDPLLALLAAPVFGFYVAFFWPVKHWLISECTARAQMGKEVSTLVSIRMVLGFLSPIVGGMIAYYAGTNVAFIVGACVALLSLVPLLFIEKSLTPQVIQLRRILGLFRKPEILKIRPAFFWEGMSYYFTIIPWILLFTIFFGSIRDLGIIEGLSILIGVWLTKLAGSIFDGDKRPRLLRTLTISRSGLTFAYGGLLLGGGLFVIAILRSLTSFIQNMHITVTDSYFYSYGKKVHPVYFNLFREYYLSLGRMLSCAMLSLAFLVLEASALWFVLGAGALMLLGWMALQHGEILLKTQEKQVPERSLQAMSISLVTSTNSHKHL